MQQPPSVSLLLSRLEEFPSKLAQTLADPERPLPPWDWRPAPDDWSLVEIVCHLRDVEREVHQERFRALLEVDNPFLSGVTSDTWAETRAYRSQDGLAALADFLAARAQTVSLLRGLDDVAWSRQGRHAFFGSTTMHELLNLAVKHDQSHWRQVETLLNLAPRIQ